MIKILLYPLSWLYGIATYLRNRAFDLNIFKSREFDIPIISIGNITVGGTGKTPHVEYLVDLLKETHQVATLSRGYKRKTQGFRLVETNSSVLDVGDEPLQIKNKFPKIIVSVCEKRVEGVKKLLAKDNKIIPEVILLDDAFQHRQITPEANILLIDYNRQVKDDKLLPLGRLRESAHQMRRANIIIFTKCPDEVTPIMRRILSTNIGLLPYQKLYFTCLKYDNFKPVFSATLLDNSFFQEKECAMLVVSGVASPKPIYTYLKPIAKKIETLEFPDHHYFSPLDIKAIEKKFNSINTERKIIITTEKDAMRFRAIEDISNDVRNAMYYLPIKVSFLEEGEKSFNKKILNYVRENKSNGKFHKR